MNERRHGDPFDHADIPGASGLSEEYSAGLLSEDMKAGIIKRRLETGKIAAEATAGRVGACLMEHEGVLYRGFALGFPQEIWAPLSGWRPYIYAGEQKPVDWGSVITEEEAFALMEEWAESVTARAKAEGQAPEGL